MKIKASELRPGQAIKIEYGAPENWMVFVVEEVFTFDRMVTVKCHSKGIYLDFSFRIDELVEVQDGQ